MYELYNNNEYKNIYKINLTDLVYSTNLKNEIGLPCNFDNVHHRAQTTF